MWVRLIQILAAGAVALLLVPTTANFAAAAGMICMVTLVVALVVLAFSRRPDDGDP